MKSISDVWTLIYKEVNKEPVSFSYTLESDATSAKTMVEDANGGELFNEKGEVDGMFELEWCYLVNGKLIAPKKQVEEGNENMLLERVIQQKDIYLIECDGGYYTENASKEKDAFGKHKEFGHRLVQDPSQHTMSHWSYDMAFSDYGKAGLKKIEELGFKNPKFTKFIRAECIVLIKG